MTCSMDRRSLIGALVVAATSPASAQTFMDWLATNDAAERIFTILKINLALNERDRAIIPAFIKRLRTPDLHTETPEEFDRYLFAGNQNELAAYVVEEFVVASNFFAVKAGLEPELRILEA